MGSLILTAALLLAAGPKPEKKDVPYLVHANNLVQTEVVKASAEGGSYIIPGETSLARTPLALPIFMMDSSAIKPDQLRMVRLTVKGGHREAASGKTTPDDQAPILLTVTNLGGGIYKFEVVNEVENGEYALTAGPGQFFCFTVF